jgi:hypothetical protein
LEEYLSREDIYEQESPFGKAINQSVDMFKATKVDIKLIEPEVTYKAGVDVKRPVAQRAKSPLEHGWILILKVAIDATGPRVLNFFSLVLYCLTVLSLCTGVLSCLGS